MVLLLNFNVSSGLPLVALTMPLKNGEMSISQKRGIISLIPKKDKDKKIPQKFETNIPIEQ